MFPFANLSPVNLQYAQTFLAGIDFKVCLISLLPSIVKSSHWPSKLVVTVLSIAASTSPFFMVEGSCLFFSNLWNFPTENEKKLWIVYVYHLECK